MAKRLPGEVTITHAAEVLGISEDTAREWARRAIDGERSRFAYARRDVVGRYFVRQADVARIKSEGERIAGR